MLQVQGESEIEGEIDPDNNSFIEQDPSDHSLSEWDKTDADIFPSFPDPQVSSTPKADPPKSKHKKKRRVHSHTPKKPKSPKASQDQSPVHIEQKPPEPLPPLPVIILVPEPWPDSAPASERPIDFSEVLRKIITMEWNSVYSSEQAFPGIVFPLFATIRQSGALTKKSDWKSFYAILTTFRDIFPQIKCSEEHKVVTTLVFMLLVKKYASEGEFDSLERITQISTTLEGFLESQLTNLVFPELKNFTTLCNRFATAKFDVDPLLNHFKQVMDGARYSFHTPRSVTDYVMKFFLTCLDSILCNKIIANPTRYCFSNAVVWNSFVTAFESMNQFSFCFLRQIVSVLILAGNFASEDCASELRTEVAPDIDPKLLIFLLKNYHTDELMPKMIDYERVARKFGIALDDNCTLMKRSALPDITPVASGLYVERWNWVEVSPELRRRWPFLALDVRQ
jgi:hypothetical protein